MKSFRRVQPGDPVGKPSASFRNALVDLLGRQHAAFAFNGGGSPGAPLVGAAEAQHARREIVRVQNVSGSTIDRYGVAGIDSPLFSPSSYSDAFKAEPLLKVTTPAAGTHDGAFVVLLEPLADDAIGRAVLAGATQVQVDVADEGHAWADVADGDATQLASAPAGSAQILWKQSGTGTKWAIVRLANLCVGRLLFGKLKADWTDSQSQVSIDPCDAAGNDNGLADVDVYVQQSKTAFDPSLATVAGDSVDIGTKVAADTIIPCLIDEDGDWVVPVQPHQVIVDSRVYAAEDELQAKVAWSWGWFTSTTSAWLDVGDVFAEDAFTVLTDNADQTAGYLDDEIEVGEAAGQPHTWLGKAVDNTVNDHKLRLYLDGPGSVEHTVTLDDGTIIEWDAKGLIVSIKGVST